MPKVAEAFAGRTGLSGDARFAVGCWERGLTGAPILETAQVSFECELAEVKEFGTHLILIGMVAATRCRSATAAALVYGDGVFLTTAGLETAA